MRLNKISSVKSFVLLVDNLPLTTISEATFVGIINLKS